MADQYRTPPVQAAVMVQQYSAREHHEPGGGHAHRHPHGYLQQYEPVHVEHTVEDISSVLGLPVAQVTPELLDALGPLLAERDSLRRQTELGARRNEILAHQAERDCVVPAFNRRAFIREVESFLAGPGPTGALAVMHVGGVEELRHVHGIAAGEGALRHVCAAALSVLRATDQIGLVGGSDFAILLPGCHDPDAQARMDDIRRHVNDPAFTWMGLSHALVTLVGVHSLVEGETGEQALAAADRRRRGIAD